MSEHIPHDLPEYEPNTNPPKWRVQVYRDGGDWRWVHQCSPHIMDEFWGIADWATALALANKHAKECL